MKRSDKYLILLFAICSLILVNNCRKETEEPEIKPDENIAILEGQALINDEFSKNLSSSTLANAITLTINWAKSQPYVASVNPLYNGIEVTYKSGRIGLIVHLEWDDYGGKIGKADGLTIKSLQEHTINNNFKKSPVQDYEGSANSPKATDNEAIGNKKVLVWSPVQEDHDFPGVLAEAFAESDLDLEIDYVNNEDCTPESVKNFENYGLIVINAHGWLGKYISSGVEATITNINEEWYIEELDRERLCIVTYKLADGSLRNCFGITFLFVKHYCGTESRFPGSVIFNASCESTRSDSLSSAFFSKGAKTYYGFDEVVSARFASLTESMVIGSLTRTYFNTGESFIPEFYDFWYHEEGFFKAARLEIKGSNKMAYMPPYWQGTFQYTQKVDATFGYTTWYINVEANFALRLTMDDPYLSEGYFGQSDLTGSISIDWKETRTDVNPPVTCTASCSGDIEPLVVSLWVSPVTEKYELTFAFDNSRYAGGTPCSGSCSNGSSFEVTTGIYLNWANWPVSLGPVPTYSTYTGDIISGTWTGPAPAPDNGGISPYDGCVIKWYLTKIVP